MRPLEYKPSIFVLAQSIFLVQLAFLYIKTLVDTGGGQQEWHEGKTCKWKLAIPNRSSLLHHNRSWAVKDKFVSFKNGQWIIEKHSAGLPECADDSRRVCVCVCFTANM